MKTGLFVIPLGDGIIQGRIGIEPPDAHVVKRCKQAVHGGSSQPLMLFLFVNVDPAQVSDIPLGEKMHLAPANLLSIRNSGKLPAAARRQLAPAERDGFIGGIPGGQRSGVVHILMLHHKAVFQQKGFHMTILFVELSVPSTGAHAEVVKECVYSLFSAQIRKCVVQQPLPVLGVVKTEQADHGIVDSFRNLSRAVKSEGGVSILDQTASCCFRFQCVEQLPSVAVNVSVHGSQPDSFHHGKIAGGGAVSAP